MGRAVVVAATWGERREGGIDDFFSSLDLAFSSSSERRDLDGLVFVRWVAEDLIN